MRGLGHDHQRARFVMVLANDVQTGRAKFAGAAGTLASLGDKGLEVQEALMAELGLGVPQATWHVARDGLAETLNFLGLVTGSLGKVALDVMMMTSELGVHISTNNPLYWLLKSLKTIKPAHTFECADSRLILTPNPSRIRMCTYRLYNFE